MRFVSCSHPQTSKILVRQKWFDYLVSTIPWFQIRKCAKEREGTFGHHLRRGQYDLSFPEACIHFNRDGAQNSRSYFAQAWHPNGSLPPFASKQYRGAISNENATASLAVAILKSGTTFDA
jgi:hypothetical protein